MTKPELPLVQDASAPRDLREAVRAARARAPSEADLTRMAASFGFGLPPSMPPPAAPVGGAAATSAKAGLLAKGAAALGAASVATAVVLRMAGPASEPPSAPQAREAQTATRSAPPPATAQREERALPGEAPGAAVTAESATLRPRREERSAAREAAPVVSAEPVAAPEPEPPAPSDSAASDKASRLREEAELVRRAQSMLSSDPAGALRLTAEHRRRFPGGVLGQEASVVAIDALLRLGRRQEAEAQARAFEAAHPGSVHARRVRKLLEGR